MLKELILRNRSYRRFNENEQIAINDLINFVDLARNSPSPRNQQVLKYLIFNNVVDNIKIFPLIGWASALPNWEGPIEGERPSAYIIILGDNSLITENTSNYFEVSYGIVAQSILLGATEKKYGGCIIANIKRKQLREVFNIDIKFEILSIIALGKPIETVVLEEITTQENYNYWRDENQVHHVPKRNLNEIILNINKPD